MRILSGVQPSGRLHLGNYYGALRQFIELQGSGLGLYFIANLHALTTVRDAATLREFTFEAALAYLSLGLDPNRSILFCQSDIPEITELYWILGSLVPLSHLHRSHAYKDKIAHGIAADLGLFAYPVLMAADILAFGADVVPVGKDQLQHLELARDWATRFNVAFVAGYDPQDPEGRKTGHAAGILKLPTARLQQRTTSVPGIDGQKMSKSSGNTIEIFGDEKQVKNRIMSIRTDSASVEAPKPRANALYQLLEIMAPPREFAVIDASWRSGGRGYAEYKRTLLEYFHAAFDEPRRRREQLLRDPAEVEQILADGARRARDIAVPVLDQVRRAVGISQRMR
ncbi:MAG: tryptophan--tRNA ligase [Gammaproteobacteria bacterium]